MSRPVTPLKIAIAKSGRRQGDIAKAVGLSESQFSRIVNGLHADEHTRKQIADEVGQSVEDLFSYSSGSGEAA